AFLIRRALPGAPRPSPGRAGIGPRAATRRLHEPGLAENLQMVGDRRLGEIECRRQVADAELVRSRQPVDDCDARWIRKGAEALGKVTRRLGFERRGIRSTADWLKDWQCLHRYASI